MCIQKDCGSVAALAVPDIPIETHKSHYSDKELTDKEDSNDVGCYDKLTASECFHECCGSQIKNSV